MDEVQTKLLLETFRHVADLFKNRNDMLIGTAVVLLDLYRSKIGDDQSEKTAAIERLQAQREWCARDLSGYGTEYLDFLIASLKHGQLDASAWLREPPAGSG